MRLGLDRTAHHSEGAEERAVPEDIPGMIVWNGLRPGSTRPTEKQAPRF